MRIFQCHTELFGFDSQLSADGVLDVVNGGVKVVDGEHGGRGKLTEVVVDWSQQSIVAGNKSLDNRFLHGLTLSDSSAPAVWTAGVEGRGLGQPNSSPQF